MKKGDYYYCEICKNLVKVVDAHADALVCCGQPMSLMEPHKVDTGKEKHVPVIISEGDKTKVILGEVPHPMTSEHYIDFIEVTTNDGKVGYASVKGQEKAEAVFNLKAQDIINVKAYCNLHGIWIKEN